MSSKKEKLFQRLNSKLLEITPKLSGVEGSYVNLDFDTNKLEDGAKKLMLRFLRNQDLCERNKQSGQEVEIFVTNPKYNDREIIDLVTKKITLCLQKDETDYDDRPGRKLQKLKKELEEKMSMKWEEEYKKRVSESKNFKLLNKNKKDLEKKCPHSGEEGDDDDKDNKSVDENEDLDEVCDKSEKKEIKNSVENNNDGSETNDKNKNIDFPFVGDENTSDNTIDENSAKAMENNEEDIDTNDECSLIPAYQPGGGLLYGGSELTQYQEELPPNLLSPSLKFSSNQSPSSKSFFEVESEISNGSRLDVNKSSFCVKSRLFENSQKPNDSFDLNDAFEFCSGKFPEDKEGAQSHSLINYLVNSEDENWEKEIDGDDDNDSNLDEEYQNVVVDDDDDDNNEDSENENAEDKENKIKNNKNKKRKNIIVLEDSNSEDSHAEVKQEGDTPDITENRNSKNLIFSDDEEDESLNKDFEGKKKKVKNLHFSDDEDEDNENNSKSDDLEEEVSEEDEKPEESCDLNLIDYDSEENEIINPREFFEKEAELSGSECSGDEDERGLDEFDREEGDADQLDNDKVRSQLEKIHIRRILDDDAREVRLIQELLFEDGDLHSNGKRRERKFKWKNLGTFDDKENEREVNEDQPESSEEDFGEEEKLRKIRHQKEMFLMEMRKKADSSSDEEIVEENFQMLKVFSGKNSLKTSTAKETRSGNLKMALDHINDGKILSSSNARGSFLTRNEEFLSRLARATSALSDNIIGSKNSKNFVFATKSPEKNESNKTKTCKRQVEDSEVSTRSEKKVKLFPREVHSGPSILDLLK